MSDESSATPLEPPLDDESSHSVRRCPACDTVVAAGAEQCIMCGTMLPPEPAPATAVSPAATEAEPEIAAEPETTAAKSAPARVEEPEPEAVAADLAAKSAETVASVDSVPGTAPLPAAPAPSRRWSIQVRRGLTAAFLFFIIVAAILILRFQSPIVELAVFPSVTPIVPTTTYTPTWTPLPSQTPRPTSTSTVTPTPASTLTPQPPRPHTVNAGETLIGLAVRYGVSMESIAGINGFSVESPIQSGQTLQIPWPTPTPPLVPVAVEINGETVIADPEGCNRYQVQAGDSLSGIAARYDIEFSLFLQVNRLTDETVLQPGDTLCIPEIVYGASLPPTPGPSPTPSPTSPIPGPYLLYPIDGTAVAPPDAGFLLQWVAVKDLAPSEWYMVEVDDLDEVDRPPFRGFTRDTAFRVPVAWRPTVPETHLFRWRVSVVEVTGERADGQFLYTYGGEAGAPASFLWLGAVPTPTPTPTSPPTPTPPPE